jgi:hypothetical protein
MTDTTYFQTIANRADTPVCCEMQMSKMLDTPMVGAMAFTGHQGFVADGNWIEDGASYKKFMDKNKYIPASEGHREAEIQRENHAKRDDKKLEAAVVEAVAKQQA